MSRRDLSQPSFVDAMVSGCVRGGGFLDRLEKAFDWSAFGMPSFAFADSRFDPRRARLSASGDVQDPASAAVACALRSWGGGGGSGPVVVSPLLRLAVAGGGEIDRDHASIWRFRQTIDFKLGAFRRRCWPKRTGRARRARPHRQARHAGGRDADRRVGQASKRPMATAGRQSARSGRAGDDEAQDGPFPATRRIWLWTRAAGLCGRLR